MILFLKSNLPTISLSNTETKIFNLVTILILKFVYACKCTYVILKVDPVQLEHTTFQDSYYLNKKSEIFFRGNFVITIQDM